jgi:hypothetical protein
LRIAVKPAQEATAAALQAAPPGERIGSSQSSMAAAKGTSTAMSPNSVNAFFELYSAFGGVR